MRAVTDATSGAAAWQSGVLPMPRDRAPSRTASPPRGSRRRSCVGVLDVVVGGLDRDPERCGDLLGLQAAGQQADDLGLALGQTRGALDRAALLARRRQHGADRVGVEPAGAGLPRSVAPPARAPAPRGAAAARSSRGTRRLRRAGERAVSDPAPRRRGGSRSRRAARGGRSRSERAPPGTASGTRTRSVWYGWSLHLLPLVGGQRPRLLPDPRGRPRPAPGRGPAPRGGPL